MRSPRFAARRRLPRWSLLALTLASATALGAATLRAQAPIAPFKAGDRYFFVGSDSALYVRDGRNGRPWLLLPAGSYATVSPSPNGAYLAYALPSAGTSTQLRIRDVRAARDVNEAIPHGRLSRNAWTRNNRGFLYVRVDTATNRERIYYHAVGTPSGQDGIVYSRQDQPDWSYRVRVSDDGQFGVITVHHPVDDNERLYFIDFDNPGKPTLDAPVVKMIDEFSTKYTFVDNGGNAFFLLTTRDAPNGRLVIANTEVTRESRWTTIIPQSADTLVMARTAGETYIVTTSYGAGGSVVRVYAPPTDRELRAEYQRMMDSARKAHERDRNRGGAPPQQGTTVRAIARGDYPMFRLNLKAQVPLPAGGRVIDMTSMADDEELFYTVQFADGSRQSFMYNVKTAANTYVNTTVPK